MRRRGRGRRRWTRAGEARVARRRGGVGQREARGHARGGELGRRGRRARGRRARDADGEEATRARRRGRRTEEEDEDAAFANTLSRGLQSGHDARVTTRVADREGQQRFQDALHAVANAFRACKRAGRTRDAEVANAVELVRDAHDRLPSEMRIPAESPYEKLTAIYATSDAARWCSR